jgi:hypothetical protein
VTKKKANEGKMHRKNPEKWNLEAKGKKRRKCGDGKL